MNLHDLERQLDQALENHRKELDFITSGERDFTRDEIAQLAKTSYYTLSQFRDAIVSFASESK